MTGYRHRAAKRWWKNDRGTSSLVFSLAAIPMFTLMGGAFDMMSVEDARAKIQAALDAGVLAAAHAEDITSAQAKTIIVNYMRSNLRLGKRVTVDYSKLKVDYSTKTKKRVVDATLEAKVKTPFLGLVGKSNYVLELNAESLQGYGGLEVALVLDTTGSMDWASASGTGTKMDELKTAAKKLVQTLRDEKKHNPKLYVKVGLVPFMSNVNVGTDKWNKSWLKPEKDLKKADWEGVVGVRDPGKNLDIRDDAYKSHKIPAVQNAWYYKDTDYLIGYDYTVAPIKPLTPLTSAGKEAIDDSIDAMSADGWTYIPAGLVWGWRVLSGKKPFRGGKGYKRAREKNIKKVIVLMTDGENTCDYRGDGYLSCGGDKGREADKRLKKLCTRIRHKGIGIISIAFAVDSDETKEILQNCANMGYYEPDSGELVETFQSIAQNLAALHLTK